MNRMKVLSSSELYSKNGESNFYMSVHMIMQYHPNPEMDMREPVSILKLFYNWCFYTFIVPFRVKWDMETKRYILVTYTIQKILCACSHTITCGYIIAVLYNIFTHIGSNNIGRIDQSFVSNGITMMSRAAFQVFYFQFAKSAWFNKGSILDMINAVTSKNVSVKRVSLLNKMSFVIGITGFVLSAFLSYRVIAHWTPMDEDTIGKNVYAIPFLTKSCSSPLLEHICLAAFIQVQLFSYANHVFLTILGAGLVGMAWDFQSDLKSVGGDVLKGMEIYRTLKWKVNVVSQAWDGRLMTFCVAVISYYGGLPEILMGYINEEPPDSLIAYFLMNTLGWILAAKFHSMVQKSFLAWAENRMLDNRLECAAVYDSGMATSTVGILDKIAHATPFHVEIVSHFDCQLKLMAVKNNLHSDPVALSCGFFSVTNCFLCSMLGMVVTYGIIIFQTRSIKH